VLLIRPWQCVLVLLSVRWSVLCVETSSQDVWCRRCAEWHDVHWITASSRRRRQSDGQWQWRWLWPRSRLGVRLDTRRTSSQEQGITHSLTHSLSVERQLLLSLMIFLLIYTLLSSWLLLEFFSESHLPDTNCTLSALCVLSWLCLVLFSSAVKQFVFFCKLC